MQEEDTADVQKVREYMLRGSLLKAERTADNTSFGTLNLHLLSAPSPACLL